ncbi:MAG TPA: Gldg family protein [Phycisphaerales bacterium]|nr:Gldg family protein [Phycisphaerales bacterium]HMP38667.1 Gldg family protein [Phycisphaerales bacterium]
MAKSAPSPASTPSAMHEPPRLSRERSHLVVAIVIVAILLGFVGFNVLAGATLRGARADLTSDRLYTLSPGVRPLLRRLEEPVKLELFYSVESGRGIPAVATYARRVQEFIEELVAAGGGKLSLDVIDPKPYSEEEDRAVEAGLSTIAIDGAGQTITLGLVAIDRVDRRATIPFLDPAREAYLEYDVLRLIESVGRTKRPRIGLLTTLPMAGATGGTPLQPQPQPTPPMQVYEQMRALFEIVAIRPADTALPADLDVLMIAHPRGLSPGLLRAIDDYALGGGRILAFIDPLVENDLSSQGAFGADAASDLGELPRAWGFEWTRSQVVGDLRHALQVQIRGRTGAPQIVEYLPWLALDGDAIVRSDPAMGSLTRINATTVGAIAPLSEAPGGVTFEPLLRSSAESMLIETARIALMPDPAGLLASFVSSDRRRTLAVRLTGVVESAYSGGDDAGSAPADDDRDGGKPGEAEGGSGASGGAAAPGDSSSPRRGSAPATIVVVADCDLLFDQNWISEERLGPISLGWREVAGNGAMVLNLLEQLSGDDAMLALRGRGTATRPFERVEEIRRAAESRFLAREQQLRDQIAAAQARIGELQQEKSPDRRLILSPAQEAEIDQLERDVLDARRELRQVRFEMRETYVSLGRRLMLFNVVLWPLIVALSAALWTVHRHRRTRRGGVR